MQQLIEHIKQKQLSESEQMTTQNENYLNLKFVNLQSPIPRKPHKTLEKANLN